MMRLTLNLRPGESLILCDEKGKDTVYLGVYRKTPIKVTIEIPMVPLHLTDSKAGLEPQSPREVQRKQAADQEDNPVT